MLITRLGTFGSKFCLLISWTRSPLSDPDPIQDATRTRT